MSKYDYLLIDARNLLYRSIYAGLGDESFVRTKQNLFVITLKFVNQYYKFLDGRQICVFWDSPKGHLWRKKLLPTYKDNRKGTPKYRVDIRPHIKEQTKICLDVFQNIGIRNFFVDGMEADDLIYAFCQLHKDNKSLIISSDSDFKQVPYTNPNVEVYNPLKKKIVEIPKYDCVVMKSLIGDTADNIDGYYGLGEKKVVPLLEDYSKLEEFFSSDKAVIMEGGKKKFVGRSLFVNNMKIIDLSMCKELNNNIIYINNIMEENAQFDLKAVKEAAAKYNVVGLMKEIPNTLIPLRKLMEMRNESITI